MFGENKNLKDPSLNTDISIKDTTFSMSYTKTHKLITALYMVTDVIDIQEPIRAKLRTLGAQIISDIHGIEQINHQRHFGAHIGHTEPINACHRISETVSFLNIASAMNFISEMNCAILKKEFFELRESIQEFIDMKPQWLGDFFQTSAAKESYPYPTSPYSRGRSKEGVMSSNSRGSNLKGHTRIGVQKGSTLMKALIGISLSNTKITSNNTDVFDVLKNQRRDQIINIIKTISGGASIKDIKDKIKIVPGQADLLVSLSEKTLQRELVSMVKDNVLNKTGEKRWSKYSIKN